MPEQSGSVLPALQWAWENRAWISEKLTCIREYLFPRDRSTVLILGSGGVGKTSIARLLEGQFDDSLAIPGDYVESMSVESFALRDDKDVEFIVAPGQEHRREATWGELEAGLSSGQYRGVVLVNCFGYHSLGEISYREHRLFRHDDGSFLPAFLEDNRTKEQHVLDRLVPHISRSPNKCWLMSVVTKQDLWWDHDPQVRHHYESGAYSQAISRIFQQMGSSRFRHELLPCSLVIANFKTGVGEELATTIAGYEQKRQVESVRRFWETIDALIGWGR